MRRLVLEALHAGAVGFATSTLEQHNGEHGIPMPSRLADEAEMLALTGALGEAGRGVFMLTKGMPSTIPWLEKIAAASGRPVMVGRGAKRRVNDLPTGAPRLDTPAVGVHGVWVNGVRTADERGVLADCGRPGQVRRDCAA